MPDMAMISAAVGSVKAAIEITKALREGDPEKAELKLKLVDLVDRLADARTALIEVQEALAQKDKRIAELEEAFETKDEVVKHGDAYYLKDRSGNPTAQPLCLRCWEVEHKKRHVAGDAERPRLFKVCPACGRRYPGGRTSEFGPGADN